MAGGSKKKKKPAANPARGFATTSIQSVKAKIDAEGDGDDATSKNTKRLADDGTKTDTPTTLSSGTKNVTAAPGQGERELHELSPEELEAQLERAELQQTIERHGPKVRKDAARQSTRLESEKRVLRGQSEYLSTRDWISDELLLEILSSIRNERNQDLSSTKRPVLPLGDELVARLWALRICLLDLRIPEDRIEQVLEWLIANPPASDGGVLLWGLSAALDWLALEYPEVDGYDTQRIKSSVEDSSEVPEQASELRQQNDRTFDTTRTGASGANTPPSEPSLSDTGEVSDIDSDAEPDELLSIYLETKTRLYHINPDSVAPNSKKKASKLSKSGSSTPLRSNPAEKKLHLKLAKIERDVLFDQREADYRWSSRVIDLARDAANRKRLEISSSEVEPAAAERMALDLIEETASLESDDILGGMFDALPGVVDDGAQNGDGSVVAVVIKNFGRLTGMNPKRVLEEACKSRDGQVKLAYKLVSPTTYASRHSLTITWSKDQEKVQNPFTTLVEVKSKARTTLITTIGIATPETAQSEAYIATVALFLLFSRSPKEEKAHMKLPPAYRDLWAELAQLSQDQIDSDDRDTVKHLRTLIATRQVRSDDETDDEEVVFNANSRRRTDGQSGFNTPVGDHSSGIVELSAVSEKLKQIWASKSAQPSYQRMLESRMRLPMFQFKEVALDTIEQHQITILCGETGCGKSTQLPSFILEHELSRGRPCKIYCTEPRRISAVSLAQRVSEELGERRGDVGSSRSLVGYSIRLESHTTAETRLIYATVGIVLRMLERPQGIPEVTHLVIDEVHERSIDTDFLLIVLRSLMLKRPDLKVVLMSATVDAQKFSDYLDGAPIITVPGRTFPVQAKFLEDAIEMTGHTKDNDVAAANAADDDFDGDTADRSAVPLAEGYSALTRSTMASYDEYQIDYSLIVKLLHKVAFDPALQAFSKASLVFLPGIAEIRQLHDILTSQPAFSQGWRIYPLHSSFSSEDQQAAFDVPPPGTRKIVLATNIAETGITIPDITCVIDTGKHREMRFDERRQLSKLVLAFIARANAKQRRGRAGRVQEGICFHLFTKHRHDQVMAEQQTPELLRLSLQDLVMRVKICKLGDIEQALSQALDPPSPKNIRRAIDALIEVNALTANEELTPLGTQIARLPLDAQLGKFVLLSDIAGCLDFGLTVAAALTSKSPFVSPMHAKAKADTVRLGFKRGDSDLLTLYNAYSSWRKACQTPGVSEYQFCNKNFLSAQNLANIEDLKGQLLTALVDAGFVTLDAAERSALSRVRPGARQRHFVALPAAYDRAGDADVVASSVLAWSFYPKILKQEGKGWRNVANNQALGLHPTSVNRHQLGPHVKLLSFYSIMQSNARFTNAQETTPVADMALVLLAGDAVFNMHAGVIVIDGNRLRYKVSEWRVMLALKMLRIRLRETLARHFRVPGKEMVGRHKTWWMFLERMFEAQRKARMI